MTRTACGHKGAYARHVGKPAGRHKGGVPYRCSRCGHRKTLPRLPRHLKRPNSRICCGHPMKVDWYRFTGAENRRQSCDCGGYHYVHRKGSLFCASGAAGKAGWHSIERGTREFAEWAATGLVR